MRDNNNTERWFEHRRSKACVNSKAAGQSFITAWAGAVVKKPAPVTPKLAAKAKTTSEPALSKYACPGIGFRQDSRIPRYLQRTVVPCGGAPRREVLKKKIIEDLTPKAHRRLTVKQLQLRILSTEHAQALWFNNHITLTLSSPRCQKFGALSSDGGDILPCVECNGLLRLKVLKNALSKLPTKKGNEKYTPIVYRNPVIGEAWMRHRDIQELMEMVRH